MTLLLLFNNFFICFLLLKKIYIYSFYKCKYFLDFFHLILFGSLFFSTSLELSGFSFKISFHFSFFFKSTFHFISICFSINNFFFIYITSLLYRTKITKIKNYVYKIFPRTIFVTLLFLFNFLSF